MVKIQQSDVVRRVEGDLVEAEIYRRSINQIKVPDVEIGKEIGRTL